MKIAYLAPVVPALSATFVYNEILQLEAMGTEVIPFSVHEPVSGINEPAVQHLQERVKHLYGQSKLLVLKDIFNLLFMHPIFFVRAFNLLLKDIWQVGVFSRTAMGMVYRFVFAARFSRMVRNDDCSHIHVHFADVPTDIAMYAAAFANITFSVTAHANDIFERGWLLPEKIARSAFFATISEFNKRFLVELGCDDKKIQIIRCGVDFNKFSARESFESGTKIKIGMLGRLVEKKGTDVLIEALAILKKENIAIELQVVGSGPLSQILLQLTQKLKLANEDIKFLGALPHKDVGEFIKSLDIFILPCKKDSKGDMDGIPVALMEAMLLGVPVISTELSGIPELIVDNTTGLTALPGDKKSLISAIKKMIEDDGLREKMSMNAIEKVKKEFSLQKNTIQLNQLFQSVIKC